MLLYTEALLFTASNALQLVCRSKAEVWLLWTFNAFTEGAHIVGERCTALHWDSCVPAVARCSPRCGAIRLPSPPVTRPATPTRPSQPSTA